SLAKFPLDAVLLVRALSLLLVQRYDCIHTHEEAGFYGALFGRAFRLPHIYDMHSDLAQQLTNFGFTRNQFLIRLMRAVERLIIRSARVVIVICPELAETVASLVPGTPTILIENTAVAGNAERQPDDQTGWQEVERLRRELRLPASGP